MFSGAIVAIVTPFKDGMVDEKAYRELINFVIDRRGIGHRALWHHRESQPPCPIKSTSRLSTSRWMKWANGSRSLPGTGSNSTTEAIRLTKHAKEAGADAALLITPYYNKPTQRGLVEHYKAVASACDIPQHPLQRSGKDRGEHEQLKPLWNYPR